MGLAWSHSYRIIQTYKVIKRIFRKHGKILSFPKDVDPAKTYSWRYISNFLKSFDSLGLDDAIIPELIESIVVQAKKKHLLHCGITVLNKVDLLDVCHQKLEQDKKNEAKIINDIMKTHAFLLKQVNGKNISELLLDKSSIRSSINLSKWYASGLLSVGYLAVSKACWQVMRKMDKEELEILPKPMEMLRIRMRILSKRNVVKELEQILGDDFHKE